MVVPSSEWCPREHKFKVNHTSWRWNRYEQQRQQPKCNVIYGYYIIASESCSIYGTTWNVLQHLLCLCLSADRLFAVMLHEILHSSRVFGRFGRNCGLTINCGALVRSILFLSSRHSIKADTSRAPLEIVFQRLLRPYTYVVANLKNCQSLAVFFSSFLYPAYLPSRRLASRLVTDILKNYWCINGIYSNRFTTNRIDFLRVRHKHSVSCYKKISNDSKNILSNTRFFITPLNPQALTTQ